MKYVFVSCGYSLAGLGAIGWIGILLIGMFFVGPGDTPLTDFFANRIVVEENLTSWGATFSDISKDLFSLMFQMNLLCKQSEKKY